MRQVAGRWQVTLGRGIILYKYMQKVGMRCEGELDWDDWGDWVNWTWIEQRYVMETEVIYSSVDSPACRSGSFGPILPKLHQSNWNRLSQSVQRGITVHRALCTLLARN